MVASRGGRYFSHVSVQFEDLFIVFGYHSKYDHMSVTVRVTVRVTNHTSNWMSSLMSNYREKDSGWDGV